MVYIVYWGAIEPLGQSLVVPSVVRLAQKGVKLTLVTFEKPSDLARLDEIARIRRILADHRVSWVPLRYHKRPKWPATGADVVHGCLRALLCRLRGPVDIVHARTFVGGPMGFLAARLLGARFIYHNEGFYPDEQVDGGVWRARSFPHRVAGALERELYGRADGIVVLSRRAQRQVEDLPRVLSNRTPVCVVPSAVDLDRFQPRAPLTVDERRTLRLVYIGSVGLRYLLDRVGRFVSILGKRAGVSLRVFSGASPDLVGSLLGHGGLSPGDWSCEWVPHEGIPGELAKSHAGLFFLTQGLSEHGCSPTKFGEYWASGLPVITTPNVSDSEEIIQHERVGVIVRGHTDDAYAEAAEQLLELLADPGLPFRCRRAAENHYSLERACQDQVAFYRRIVHAEDPDERS